MKKIRAKCRVQSAENIMPRIAIAGVLILLMAIAPVTVMADHEGNSCISCHLTLDSDNARPAQLWEGDVHQRAGLDCTDCHGGDRTKIEEAMDRQKGFTGVPSGMENVLLCGGCHSDSVQISNPVLPTGQLDQFMAGPHGRSLAGGGDGPLCTTCHGSHGIVPVGNPASGLMGRHLAEKCLGCHDKGEGGAGSSALKYLESVHYTSLEKGLNLNAPTCISCHGAHKALTPTPAVSARICGRCHNRELEHFQSGPHGHSLTLTGQPACTDCHDHHLTLATGLKELVGRITDSCWGCHPTGSEPWEKARAIDESLVSAMSLLEKLEQTSSELARGGIQTSQMDLLNQEAYSWLVQVESALHSVDNRWEELTGMAKVKMMASWDLSRDHFLERRIRTFIFLLLGLLFTAIFVLLVVKLKAIEREQHRKHILGSPEARQKEQERHSR